jgi:hypothetical protein
VVAEPDRRARDRPGQHRLLGGRERGGHASGDGRRLSLDRLRQRPPASEARPAGDQEVVLRVSKWLPPLPPRSATCSRVRSPWGASTARRRPFRLWAETAIRPGWTRKCPDRPGIVGKRSTGR